MSVADGVPTEVTLIEVGGLKGENEKPEYTAVVPPEIPKTLLSTFACGEIAVMTTLPYIDDVPCTTSGGFKLSIRPQLLSAL
jgi:hypothetical protein